MSRSRFFLLLLLVSISQSSLKSAEVVDYLPVGAPQIVANYRNDFTQPEPSNNWSFWWNELSTVDRPLAYSELYWNGRDQYDSDGEIGLPDNSFLAWGGLMATGGRTGDGVNQDIGDEDIPRDVPVNKVDRFVVAAYTVQEDGIYSIANSYIKGQRASGNGVELRIYAGESLVYTGFNDGMPDRRLSFDQSLGFLKAKETIFVSIGPNGDSNNDIFNLDFSIAFDEALRVTSVADYIEDFGEGTPTFGWQYLWNRNGPIGEASGYVPLHWDDVSSYDSNGIAGLPDDNELQWGKVSRDELAPGLAQDRKVQNSRYVIAAFTLREAGQYSISNSQIKQLVDGGDGTDVRVYVNDVLAHSIQNGRGETSDFNCLLGSLKGGDTIYVGVGANKFPGVDRAYLDYTITRIGR